MKILRFILLMLIAGCTMVAPVSPTPPAPTQTDPTVTAFASAIPPTSPPPPLFYLPYHPEWRHGSEISVSDYVCETLYVRFKVTQYEISLDIDPLLPVCQAAVRDAKTPEEIIDILNNGVGQ